MKREETIKSQKLFNNIKRQTRAIIDRNRNLFKKSHNYIIMIRKSCVSKKFNTLEEALIDLLKK